MKKVKNSISGVFVGVILILASIFLLWWNEENNVKNIKTTSEIKKIVVDVPSNHINNENDGKLIATNGDLIITDDSLKDIYFNVGVKTAKLVRIVEMYQWKEESETDSDDNKTYNYTKVWSDSSIDSSDFHNSGHENPTNDFVDNNVFYADNVKVGEFNLQVDEIKQLNANEELMIPDDAIIPENYSVQSKYISNTKNMSSPEIGDLRISYKYNNSKTVSILAVQSGNSFRKYISKYDKKVDRLEDGALTGQEMIINMENENKLMKWVLRGFGLLLSVIGFTLLFGPISLLASYIPIVNYLVNTATAIVGLFMGSVISLIVIAIAWIRFRPLLGISLLFIATILLFVLFKFSKKKKIKNDMMTNPDNNITENIQQDNNLQNNIDQSNNIK